MRNAMKPSNSASLIVALLVLSVASPLVSADVEISVSANPMAAEATTDDAAEYDIIVQNSGDDDALVSLSTQQGNDCSGFTSTLETTTSVQIRTETRAVLGVLQRTQIPGGKGARKKART